MAGEQIIAGASKLVDQKKTTDFHKELLLLRQHYRLRRAGDKILGDVSYRTCGSRYNAQSTFEILRDTENEQQPLKIRLPPELRSTIWISVRVEECELNDTMNPEIHLEQRPKPVSTYQYIVRNQSFPRKFLVDLKRAQEKIHLFFNHLIISHLDTDMKHSAAYIAKFTRLECFRLHKRARPKLMNESVRSRIIF